MVHKVLYLKKIKIKGRIKGRSSATGIPLFFLATIVSELHNIKTVTVLSSSHAYFGT